MMLENNRQFPEIVWAARVIRQSPHQYPPEALRSRLYPEKTAAPGCLSAPRHWLIAASRYLKQPRYLVGHFYMVGGIKPGSNRRPST